MSGNDDDTFNAVVSEFSQMVYTHPDRLRKKSDLAGFIKEIILITPMKLLIFFHK